MSLFTRSLPALLLLATATPLGAQEANLPGGLSRFSQLQSIEDSGWEPLEFPNIDRDTSYTLVEEDGATVVKAETRGGASGLIARGRMDPAANPVIQWRWKVSNVYENGNAREKSGDDYPARIYVAFAFEPDRASFFERTKRKAAAVFYDEEIPGTALNYIWANKLEKGTIVANPFSKETQMVAVNSGDEQVGEWVSVRRNIIEDYEAAFGREPPAIIGIGIMSDSDNTGEGATAWYGDIVLMSD